ncbi:MAG: M28 family peptidase [Blastocatellales bacterium]
MARFRFSMSALFIAVLLFTSQPASVFTQQVEKTARLAAAEQEAVALVNADTIRDVTIKLASKEMAGRGTAQPGADRAAKYIADLFKQLGLRPGGDNNTYFQKIKFKIERALPVSQLKVGDATFSYKDEFVILPPFPAGLKDVSGGLVFAGYGVVSPELNRDDIAGVDVKGKIVLLLGGKPGNVDAAAWAKIANRTALLADLAKRGAVGFIFTESTQQPYGLIAAYVSRRRVSLSDLPPNAPRPPQLPMSALISNAAAEKLFASAGLSFAEIKRKAEAGEFVSRDMGKSASISAKIEREERPCRNVIGVLEGSDARLKDEAVVYTAHYDAYGVDSDGTIYPGAGDNALGVGKMVAIAEAYFKSKSKLRRSIIFIALTGEEYGLLGAEHWVWHPTWPIEKVAANINFDGIGSEAWGPLGFVLDLGAGHSDLNDIFKDVAAANGVSILPDPNPAEGFFYRSDHYAFFKRGVPALYLVGGPQGSPFEIMKRVNTWLARDYHMATDTVHPDWNWGGARTLSVLGLLAGIRVANQESMPAWIPTSPYNRPRGTSLLPPKQQR